LVKQNSTFYTFFSLKDKKLLPPADLLKKDLQNILRDCQEQLNLIVHYDFVNKNDAKAREKYLSGFRRKH